MTRILAALRGFFLMLRENPHLLAAGLALLRQQASVDKAV